MFRVFCLLIGYALGCLQSAYFLGKYFYKIDIREHGSGNAGATNINRVLGIKAGIAVFVCDVLKGAVSVLVCSLLFGGEGTFTSGASYLPALYGGLGAVIGHDFPVHLKFKGGKGVSASLGCILCVNPIVAAIAFVLGIISVTFSKMISLGSLVVLIAFPLLLALFSAAPEEVAIAAIMAGLTYYQHRGNIQRLLSGNERKFSFKRKEGAV